MQINDPAVVAELRELYHQYETALVTNDVDRLVALFWDSPLATRFGIAENLHGFEEIASFRKGRSPVNLESTIRRLDIVAFGQIAAKSRSSSNVPSTGVPFSADRARPG